MHLQIQSGDGNLDDGEGKVARSANAIVFSFMYLCMSIFVFVFVHLQIKSGDGNLDDGEGEVARSANTISITLDDWTLGRTS